MKNKEYYKDIDIDDTVLSDRIKKWAKKNGILSLYELIEAFQKRELDLFDDVNVNEIFQNTPESDDVSELDNLIILNDENGEEVKFEFLDLIEYKNKEYVVLLPANEDNGEVVILEIQDDNSADSDEESYTSVDDEDTLHIVFEIFKERFKDEFDFV